MNPIDCLCARTRRAARQLTLIYEESLRPAQLTPSQFELMGKLTSHSKLTQSEMAAALALDQTTLSRNLSLLVERRWVAAEPSATDRRKITYTLTPDGKSAWRKALPLWQAAQQQIEQHLGTNLHLASAMLDRLAEPVSA